MVHDATDDVAVKKETKSKVRLLLPNTTNVLGFGQKRRRNMR